MNYFDNEINKQIKMGTIMIVNDENDYISTPSVSSNKKTKKQSTKKNMKDVLNEDEPIIDDHFFQNLKSSIPIRNKNMLRVNPQFVRKRRFEVMEKAYFDAFEAKWLEEKSKSVSPIAIALSVSDLNLFQNVIHIKPQIMSESPFEEKDKIDNKSSLVGRYSIYRYPSVEIVNRTNLKKLFINENTLGNALTRLRHHIYDSYTIKKKDHYPLTIW